MIIRIEKPADLAPYIDHTNLKPEAKPEDITKLCEEAKKYGFATVCIRSEFVKFAKGALVGSTVKVCSVIGFPREIVGPENCHFGNMPTEEKVKEAQKAIRDGADELDMVINIDELKNDNEEYVNNDILRVKVVADGKTLKVIIEARVLSDEQKILACRIAEDVDVDFVKTSTGFVKDKNGKTLGATVEDVKLMRKQVGDKLGVKASGGIGDYVTAKAMIEAGANRLGCSASVKIVGGE
ncbi:MAG: deoxyribose-phosphate aldolase [Candidatus Margulisbacteria bacterium]|nr:deoxyribose-phosphate aldolase [Candidatus Margulisiibacteriota bacterium]